MSTSPAAALPAATIVVARHCPEDTFEVFLVKRHGKSGFMAGAHVFPGGKVDDDDSAFDVDRFAVCAIRETFEETGVLLARPESGLPLSTNDPIAAVSARLTAGEPFSHAMAAAGLVPDVSSLVPVAWWITPEAEPRRFDTRFFFAVVPSLQRHTAAADGEEVEDGIWISPADALSAYATGRIMLSPPTLVTLEELAPLSLSAVSAQAWPSTAVRPFITEDGGTMVLTLPGDPLHDQKEASQVWPNRTRIVVDADGRFRSGASPG